MVEDPSRRRVLTIAGAGVALCALINLSAYLENWLGIAAVVATAAVAAPLMHFHERRAQADTAHYRSDRWRRDRTRIIAIVVVGAALYLLTFLLFSSSA